MFIQYTTSKRFFNIRFEMFSLKKDYSELSKGCFDLNFKGLKKFNNRAIGNFLNNLKFPSKKPSTI